MGEPAGRSQREMDVIFPAVTEAGRLCREKDWAATPLGPVEQWPQSLKTTAGLVIRQGIAMNLCWGPDLVQIYNDAYRLIMGEKHPQGLGRSTLWSWSEIRDEIEPLLERVWQGETVYFEDRLLRVKRSNSGEAQDAYFTFSYSPVLVESGKVGGVLINCHETTEQVWARVLQKERDFLGEASLTLAASLDYETTLRDVAHLAIPAHADFCLVDLVGADGEIRRVAIAHRDPQKEEVYREIECYPPDSPRSPLARTLRTGEACLLSELTEETLDAISPNEEHRRLIRDELGTRSLMTVPLSAQGRTLGVMTFGCTWDSGRRYGQRDLELAAELARRAAIAVDHARLYRKAKEARTSLEHQAMKMELQMEEFQNQAAQLEANQVELETANDDLQRVNRELGAAETHYRRLVATSPYGVYVLNADGEFREMNPAGERILGRPSSEVLGRDFGPLIAPEDLEVARDAFVRIMTGTDESLERELYIQRPSGERRLVNIVISGIRENGTIIGIHGVARDITEERSTQESLRDREARHRTLLQAVPDLIFRHTRSGKVLDLQAPEGTRDLHVPAEQIRERNVLDLLPGDIANMLLARTEEALRSGDLQRFEYDLPNSESMQSFEARMVPSGPDEVLTVVRNVTDQKRAAEREKEFLREQTNRAQAEAASRAKSEFLSRMSHELRTPLNAILGFGQILEMELETEEDQESVDQILRAGKHLLSLVDEVLDIARIEAGQMSLSVEPVSVRSVLQESVDLVRLAAAKQGIMITGEDALASEYFVAADQQRLKQVLLNLLSNAIKYNRREGTVTLSCEKAGEDRLRISVRDTGYGIPPEKQERLFTPFDRLGADSTGVQGTGLGLALSKGLVEAMAGTLGVESVEEEGSCFWVEFPLVLPAGTVNEEPIQRLAEVPQEAAGRSHTVLFVEDNLANVRLMERIFQRRPHVRLLTAMQGRLGLELAREHRPDLILLDLNLPDLAGDQVVIQIRQDPELRGIPVVMISGDAIPSQVERLLGHGVQEYVTKPFDIRELLRIVDANLRRDGR